MASTESMRLSKALAGWSLARARRLVGDAYLTLKIASSAAEIGGVHFHPILAWESAFAGARDVSFSCNTEFLGGAVQRLIADPNDAASLSSLAELSDSSIPYGEELCALRAARGAACVATPTMERWLEGEDVELMRGLRGVFDARPDHPFGWIRITPGSTRRELALRGSSDIAPRVRVALATLALQGPDMEQAEFFRAVYGFEFDAGVHGALFRKLVSRLRKAIADESATLSREGERICLRVQGELWLPDPRCVPSVEDHVRWVFSQSPGSTLRQVAERCGLPTRTVQRVAQEMVEAGVLSSKRVHRQVLYRVEDSIWTNASAIHTDVEAERQEHV